MRIYIDRVFYTNCLCLGLNRDLVLAFQHQPSSPMLYEMVHKPNRRNPLKHCIRKQLRKCSRNKFLISLHLLTLELVLSKRSFIKNVCLVLFSKISKNKKIKTKEKNKKFIETCIKVIEAIINISIIINFFLPHLN